MKGWRRYLEVGAGCLVATVVVLSAVFEAYFPTSEAPSGTTTPPAEATAEGRFVVVEEGEVFEVPGVGMDKALELERWYNRLPSSHGLPHPDYWWIYDPEWRRQEGGE